MAIDQNIILKSLNHHINSIQKEIILLWHDNDYSDNDSTKAQNLITRIDELLKSRTRLHTTGTPLTNNLRENSILKPFLINAIEAYRGTVEERKIGTDKDSKISDISDQINEFR